MHQLKKLRDALTTRQQIAILLAVLCLGGAFSYLMHWRQESDFRPLFKAMSTEDASAVILKLKETSTPYRIAENGTTVLVPSDKAAELRLDMAGAGLPKSGRIGFELFDRSNFGITDFSEQVNFRRAIEGELERSVMSIGEVEQARVHVTFPKDSVYLDARQPAKASVLVKMRSGARMPAQSVIAITHLTASAVEGLVPEAVSVLDMRGNLLSRPHKGGADFLSASDSTLEYKEKLERDVASKINATLEPLFGANRFRTGVFVDCDFTSGEQSEEIVDPDHSVMVSSQRTEDRFETAQSGGVPGTAATLPRASTEATKPHGANTRRTENIAYQTSRTMKRVKLAQGEVRRMSVSVLLDYTSRWEGTGPKAKRILAPPAPEKLKSVKDLVSGIIGFDEERGDQLIVEALPFEATENEEPPPSPQPVQTNTPAPALTWQQMMKDPKIIGGVTGGVVLLVVLVVGVRKLTKKKPAPVLPEEIAAGTDQKAIGPEGAGSEDGAYGHPALASPVPLSLPSASASRLDAQLGPLRESVKKESEAYATVIRGWVNESE